MNHFDLCCDFGSTMIVQIVFRLLSVSFGYAELIHVDPNTTKVYDGTSWNNAFDLEINWIYC